MSDFVKFCALRQNTLVVLSFSHLLHVPEFKTLPNFIHRQRTNINDVRKKNRVDWLSEWGDMGDFARRLSRRFLQALYSAK